MRCALNKEILYLDKEIEDIEKLRDVNNKKIKCTKSYYINNTQLLLDYFTEKNYTQAYAINIKDANLKTDFPDNCFIDIGRGKMYCLRLPIYKTSLIGFKLLVLVPTIVNVLCVIIFSF